MEDGRLTFASSILGSRTPSSNVVIRKHYTCIPFKKIRSYRLLMENGRLNFDLGFQNSQFKCSHQNVYVSRSRRSLVAYNWRMGRGGTAAIVTDKRGNYCGRLTLAFTAWLLVSEQSLHDYCQNSQDWNFYLKCQAVAFTSHSQRFPTSSS
jgi:hypothetical protein